MYGKMQEDGFTEIIPFIYISAIWGLYSVFFHILSSFGAHHREWLQSLWLKSLMTVTSLFADRAGNIPLITIKAIQIDNY